MGCWRGLGAPSARRKPPSRRPRGHAQLSRRLLSGRPGPRQPQALVTTQLPSCSWVCMAEKGGRLHCTVLQISGSCVQWAAGLKYSADSCQRTHALWLPHPRSLPFSGAVATQSGSNPGRAVIMLSQETSLYSAPHFPLKGCALGIVCLSDDGLFTWIFLEDCNVSLSCVVSSFRGRGRCNVALKSRGNTGPRKRPPKVLIT